MCVGGGVVPGSRTAPVRELGARSGYDEVRRQVRGQGASGRFRRALSCSSATLRCRAGAVGFEQVGVLPKSMMKEEGRDHGVQVCARVTMRLGGKSELGRRGREEEVEGVEGDRIAGLGPGGPGGGGPAGGLESGPRVSELAREGRLELELGLPGTGL